MKLSFIIVLTLFLLSIISCGEQEHKTASDKYHVYKIDSINNYFLIYARYNDTVFKIVSKKVSIDCDRLIKEEESYNFILHSYFEDSFKDLTSVSAFSLDSNTVINLKDDSTRDLYYSENIHGLCFYR